MRDGLYKLHISDKSSSQPFSRSSNLSHPTSCSIQYTPCTDKDFLWHVRMGHPSVNIFQKLSVASNNSCKFLN